MSRALRHIHSMPSKKTIEQGFSDIKEKHDLRWAHYRGLKNEAQAMLSVYEFKPTGELPNGKTKHRLSFSFAWLSALSTFIETIPYLWNKMGFRRMSETHFVNCLKFFMFE
ncbi:hypothetical protein [Parageobacillus sp. KH3-4]|uniref:hypothetical protein n=1 Tax=Parageobacillus sp. KH3-4 TaxID=2916802 RepID=UPI001FCAAD75|nr:hypothetical protein [Parageobacillus sp. KH3-4]BDG48325.1 hypothetical protein PspKH34_28860 [Parageobacillus sp. KH3-4]